MTTIIRALAFALAALSSGQAPGQEADKPERLSLHGVATQTIAAQQAPVEPRLRLYLDTRRGLPFSGQNALPDRAPRVGVEFSLAPNPALAVAGGLLHTKLSESTNLSVRVRRHGVGVVLRSEF